MGKGKAGQGGTKLLDMVGGIKRALPSIRWRGLWPSKVILRQPDMTALASVNSLLGAGRPAGSEARTVLSHLPFRCDGGTDARPRAQRPLPSAFSNPRPKAHSRGTQSPGDTQSRLETGYSIRVTPTCKTETLH